MAVFLRNGAYPGTDISALGFGNSVPKPAIVDNGPVLFETIKPISSWARYFFDGYTSSKTGSLITRWIDGVNVKKTVERSDLLLGTMEPNLCWLPGTPNQWNTGSSLSYPWIYGSQPQDFDSVKLAAIAKANTEGWDLGTLFAERRETLNTIRTLIPTLMSQSKWVLSSFKSHSAARSFFRYRGDEGASATWLHARYGIRPLVFDLFEAYDRLTKVHEQLFRIQSEGSDSLYQDVAFQPGILPGNNTPREYTHAGGQPAAPLKGTAKLKVMRTSSAYCGIGVRTAVSGKTTFNAALTAWELVPFSFVIDWVLNVGDNILAWAPVADRELEYAWMTIRDDYVLESSASFAGTNLFAGLAKPPTSSVYYVGRSVSTLAMNTTVYAHSLRRLQVDLADVPYGLDVQLNLDWWKAFDLAALCSVNRSTFSKLVKKLNL